MSLYLETLYDALRTVVAATWPDVDPDGIFEADHLDMIPWQDLTPPYAVLAIGSMPQDTATGPADGLCYLPVVDIFYVATVSGPRSAIRAKLEALRDALWYGPLALGQVRSLPSMDWSADLPANQVLAAKGMSQRAGRLQVGILVGEIFSR